MEQAVLSAIEEEDEELLGDLAQWQKEQLEIAGAIPDG